MSTQYTRSEESQEDEYGPKRVFSIKHSEIPKGITQCAEHKWLRKGTIELECTKCPTVIIVNPDVIDSMV